MTVLKIVINFFSKIKKWVSKKNSMKHIGIIMLGIILFGMLTHFYHIVHCGGNCNTTHLTNEIIKNTTQSSQQELERLERVAEKIDKAVKEEVMSNDTEVKSDDILLVLDSLRVRYLSGKSRDCQ